MADHKPSRLLVGLGSHHGDDQVGWRLVEELGNLTEVPIRQAAVPADLLHWLTGIDELYVCDACQGSGQPGKLHRWEYQSSQQALDDILPGVETLRSVNTHQLGLAATLSLARGLHILPRQIVVWGIEGKRFEAGLPISAELAELLPGIIRQLANELDHA
ncbi:MAG TPA: hydrogenase maturation protease [Gemmatales bacterium]|nr:hydrogenase maturation protease [Gemmatales bacterium]